jgi:hypothetical protein
MRRSFRASIRPGPSTFFGILKLQYQATWPLMLRADGLRRGAKRRQK